MKVLVIGGGGREHAVARSFSKSKKCSQIFILPGNAGTAEIGQNILGDVNDFNLIKNIVLLMIIIIFTKMLKWLVILPFQDCNILSLV